MPDHRFLQDVTTGLMQLVQQQSAAAPLPLPLQIVTRPPTPDAQQNDDNKVSLWLYHITENEFVKNQPLPRRPAAGNGAGNGNATPQWEARSRPLALDLYYLVTPLANQEERGQELLGKVMRILYDNGIVLLAASGGGRYEMRVSLCRMALEELTRVWDALRQPYRLSVCYQIRVAQIDSSREVTASRVTDQTAGFDVKNPAP